MASRLFVTTALVFLLFLTGCATSKKMAFHDDSYEKIEANNSIYLMTATIRNNYRASHQPKLLSVNLEKAIVEGSYDRINYAAGSKASDETPDPGGGNSYLLRMELEPGNYIIRGFTCMSSSFPIHGMFFAPIHENVDVSDTGVFYLGHVEATVRERGEDEFKAGPSIPLIDQAVAGASVGTFDIEITDQWDKDESVFKNNFPRLAKVDIKKVVLPPFDRNRAQKWWDEN